MGLISTLARLEAFESGRARPLATVRHRHLAPRPLVLAALDMAGEAAAPLAALVGTDPAAPTLLVVPQPLDRDQRFAFLAALAEQLLPHIDAHTAEVELVEPPRNKKDAEPAELCADAAQLIVPNASTIAYLGLLGRSTRFRRTVEEHGEGEYRVPARVPLLGRWLTHYAERAQVPGSSLLLSATGLLSRHWATGQSAFEDLQLATQLAWIDPPGAEDGEARGGDGRAAAARAESERDADGMLRHPPAGPSTDPEFDRRALQPALDAYDAVRTRIRLRLGDDRAAAAAAVAALTSIDGSPPAPPSPGSPAARVSADDRAELALREQRLRELSERQLRPTWESVWQAVELVRGLPPGARVPDRWERDRWSFTGHRDRVAAGEAPQPRLDDAVGAARRLAVRERALAELEVQEALDDPLVMAERRLEGEAFAGRVTDVEAAYVAVKKSVKPRPRVSFRTGDRPFLEAGREVFRAVPAEKGWAAQKLGVLEWDPAAGTVLLEVRDRMGRKRDPEPGTVPEPGDELVLTLFEQAVRGGPSLPEPEEVPWTHGGPPVPADPEEEWS